jgi:hypothetical protein
MLGSGPGNHLVNDLVVRHLVLLLVVVLLGSEEGL